MPVVIGIFFPCMLEQRTNRRYRVCIVKANKPPIIRTVQCQAVLNTVWTLCAYVDPAYLELDPIADFILHLDFVVQA